MAAGAIGRKRIFRIGFVFLGRRNNFRIEVANETIRMSWRAHFYASGKVLFARRRWRVAHGVARGTLEFVLVQPFIRFGIGFGVIKLELVFQHGFEGEFRKVANVIAVRIKIEKL